jgi:hypothetical protein
MKIRKQQLRIPPDRLRNHLEQSAALRLPRGQQPSMRLLQSAVAIPRMANQLPRALRHGLKHRAKYLLIQTPGSQNPDRPVGGHHPMFLRQPQERLPLTPHEVHLRPSPRTSDPRSPQAPRRLKRIAYAIHPTVPCRTEQGSQRTGKRMDMFVRVDVAYRDPAQLNAPYLGNCLGLDLLLADAASHQVTKKTSHRRPKRERRRTPGIEKRRHLVRPEQRCPAHQHYVAANRECRLRKSEIHCRREIRSGGHQSSGAESPRLLKFNDGAVDAWRQTKVVCVDYQAFHFRQCTKVQFTFSCIKASSSCSVCEHAAAANYSYVEQVESATIVFL